MRRDDEVAALASDEERGLVGKRVQRIGIEHERPFALVEQLTDERRHRFAAAESRTGDDDVRVNAEDGIGSGEMNRAVRSFVEAFRHVFGGMRGDGRLA